MCLCVCYFFETAMAAAIVFSDDERYHRCFFLDLNTVFNSQIHREFVAVLSFLHPCSLEGKIRPTVTSMKGFHLKGPFTQNCNFTHLLFTSMWTEALLLFSNPHLRSEGSQVERISPVANTMEADDGCVLQHKQQRTINSILLMWFHPGVQ